MSDSPPITPSVRHKVKVLLRSKALTLLGSRNHHLPSDDALILPIAHKLPRQVNALGYDWDNDTQHVAMRQKVWSVIFHRWPTPTIDIAHACRPDILQVVPQKGARTLIAQRKLAAGIQPGKPAYTPQTPPPPPPPPPPQPPQKPCDPNLGKYVKSGKYSKKHARHTPGSA